MSADLLREATAAIRHDYGPTHLAPRGDPFMLAVADLLAGMAYSCSLDGHAPNTKALAVARAYLGADS